MTGPRVTLVSGLGVSRLKSPNEPQDYEPPLGVLSLAAHLRDSFPVSIVDLDYLWRRAACDHPVFQRSVVEEVFATHPDVLGFSSISGSYPLTIRLAERCARLLPEATIIFGGPQATVTDIATMDAFPFVDLILRGEADDSFPALVAALAANSPTALAPGLTFRDRSRIRRNPNGPALLDMDRLPLPAFDLVPHIGELTALPLEIGRGCPFSCTFCSTNDFFRRRFRLKSPAHVLDEMNRLHSTWGVTSFGLVHDMFTVDRHRVVAFCETMIAAGSPYKWSCSARTDSVDVDLLRQMQRAGCRNVFFGIETGSRRMQRVIDKDLDLDVARAVLRESNALEVHADASLIIGYPQETREDLRDTVNFFADAMLMPWIDPQLNVLSPLAATPITDQYRDQLTLDENWEQISENGTLQDPVDRLMITSHPDIFPNFYAFPFYTDRAMLRRLRDFLFYGLVRCGGLMRALYLHTRDMLAVFDEWDRSCPNRSTTWFGCPEFVQRLISFSEAHYPSDPSITATASFYRSANAIFAGRRNPPNTSEPYLALAENAVVFDSTCDISAILEALASGNPPEPETFVTPVTVVVRLIARNRAQIMRFPPVTLDLLRHAEKGSTLAEIERDIEDRGVHVHSLPAWKMVLGGIDYLERMGLVCRVVPSGTEASREITRRPLRALAN